jgi:hypothetical protein
MPAKITKARTRGASVDEKFIFIIPILRQLLRGIGVGARLAEGNCLILPSVIVLRN